MMDKTYEKDLNQRWATAEAGLNYSRMINTAGRDAIELAEIRLVGERAQLAFDKVHKELMDYVKGDES